MLNAGGAICAAAVATWAHDHMRGDVLLGGSLIHSRAACPFQTLPSHGVGCWGSWFVGRHAFDGHPGKWCCHVHLTRYPSISISVGYGHTCSCLHPQNSMRRRGVCRICCVLKSVGLCLYLCLCCVNYWL